MFLKHPSRLHVACGIFFLFCSVLFYSKMSRTQMSREQSFTIKSVQNMSMDKKSTVVVGKNKALFEM